MEDDAKMGEMKILFAFPAFRILNYILVLYIGIIEDLPEKRGLRGLQMSWHEISSLVAYFSKVEKVEEGEATIWDLDACVDNS
jgi:hypothetical protein